MLLSDQDQKVFLITGASSGIGYATAKLAASEGYHVIASGRSRKRLDKLVQEIEAFGGNVFPIICDVSDYQAQESMIDQIIKNYGRLDIVFANAGIGDVYGSFCSSDPKLWHTIVMTNVLGVAYTVRASMKAVLKAKGHVLMTGSVVGRRVLSGSFYSATKWAVSAIGYALREELRGTGVRVSLVQPGTVDTGLFEKPRPEGLAPEDIARSVLYAISQPSHVDVHEVMILPTPPVKDDIIRNITS